MLVLSEEIRVHSLLTGYYFTHKAWALLAMGYFVVAKVIKLIQYLLGGPVLHCPWGPCKHMDFVILKCLVEGLLSNSSENSAPKHTGYLQKHCATVFTG